MDGYYNYLLTFIDKAVDDGFIMPSQRSIIVSAPSPKELVQKLEVGSCDHILLVDLCFFFFLFSNFFTLFGRNMCLCMMELLPRLSGRQSKWSSTHLCKLKLLVNGRN